GSIEKATDEALERLEKAKQKAAKREAASADLPKEKLAKRGKRGQGCVYRPGNSRFWWVKFSVRGKVFQETANTESRKEALDFLSNRKGEETSGTAVHCEKVTVALLAEKMTKTWEREQRKESTRDWAGYCWKHLLPYFGSMK